MGTHAGTYLLGVDGGGTRCRFALADSSGRVIARHEAGAANIATDFEAAAAGISAGLRALWAGAGMRADGFGSAVCYLGLAGANLDGVGERLKARLPFRICGVGDDRLTTVVGALGGADGGLASVGTGSFLCRQADGALRSLGGWGFVAGDQASGAWLGQQALRCAVLAHDGLAPEGPLARALLGRLGGIQGLASFSLGAKPHEFAAFAPEILAAADAGDAAAVGLLRDGADYICRGLAVLGHRPGERLCLLGGLGEPYRRWLPEAMATGLVAPGGSALDGALTLAGRLAKVPVVNGGHP